MPDHRALPAGREKAVPAVGEENQTRQVRSFCRLCMATCGLTVTVKGERVIDVRGDASNPHSSGYTCPKGRALGDLHHHPDRLGQPTIRRGAEARAVAWSEMFEDLAGRLEAVVAESGPSAVAMYLGTGSAFDAAGRRTAEKFLRGLRSPQLYTALTIDTPCKPLVMELVAGHPGVVPLLDWERADFALLLGTNPVVSHGHSNPFPDPVRRLREIAARGELWVIDPRRTETAQLANRHLAIRPGSDHVLVAHLLRELLRDGVDVEDLRRRATGVEELRAAVEPYDTDRAAAACGVAEDALHDLLLSIRRFGVANAQTGTGVTMTAQANVAEWLVWALNIVTGSYDRPGGMWFNPGYLRRLQDRPWTPRSGEPAPGPASRPDLAGRLGEYPCAALVDEIESGNVRAFINVGGNPPLAFPDAPRTVRALEQLDVFATADIVHTESTTLSTHVLPVAGQLERADIPHFIDGHLPSYGSQYTPAVVPPGGDRRPLWWVMAQLGRRLEVDLLGGRDPDACTDDDALAFVIARSPVSLEDLKAGPVSEGPIYGWLTPLLPRGGWRLAPAPLLEQLRDLLEPPPLSLVPRRQPRHLNSAMRDGGGPARRRDEPWILLHPEDAADAGVIDGAAVSVRTATGSITGIARLDPDIRRGAVSVPHGWHEVNVSELTSGRCVDGLTGMVLQGAVPVSVAPA